ncbi:hypothetical protein [Hyphomicrobium sp.]|uniref:hypothetical protein n=1 Tax=Hyphomicrobium sp. TaxID=82 RepID=UPI0025BA335E|nr:hypothetical protein [Hyphomicrobium sp.]MCC7250813.1 hypothetical protein [Hyphomicrobium sp.]
MTNRTAASIERSSETTGTGLWIALIAGLTVIGSYALACVAPLAAVAALAALTLSRTEGLILVVAAWLVNQAVGFLLLSYPHTAETYAWGAAIGAAAVLGYFAAASVVPRVKSTLVAVVASFIAAFAVYQAGLYAFGVATSYAGDSFSLAVVGEVLMINAVAYVGFLAIHRAAVALALVKPAVHAAPVSA